MVVVGTLPVPKLIGVVANALTPVRISNPPAGGVTIRLLVRFEPVTVYGELALLLPTITLPNAPLKPPVFTVMLGAAVPVSEKSSTATPSSLPVASKLFHRMNTVAPLAMLRPVIVLPITAL